jgi:hypothetical protein
MKISREMMLSALACAALAIAPGPAFAQHGGGGGSHGGGGGGFHGGGGGFGGGARAGSSAPAPSSGTHTNTSASGAGNTANPNGGGHWWNGGHSNSANNAKPAVATTPVTTGVRPNTVVATVPRVFQPNRPGYGYYPYYPYYYNPYYGGLFWGSAFGGCDPFFYPCFGYGFGFGAGYGYGFGGYGGYGAYGGGTLFGGSSDQGEPGWTYSGNSDGTTSSSGDYTIDAQGGNATGNVATGTEGGEPAPSVNTSDPTVVLREGAAPAAPAKPNTLLYLKDGSSFAVSDYWLAQGRLHYVTSYGGENTMDLGKLDIQKTVDENAAQGNAFSLKAAPDTQK